MLNVNVELRRKIDDFNTMDCQIVKVIALAEAEFSDFVARPFTDRQFIADNKSLMGRWDNHAHCLLVLGEDQPDGILVESEGSDYARYAAYLPVARRFIERELEQVAASLLRDLEPDSHGRVSITFDDLSAAIGAEVTDDCALVQMFQEALERHPIVRGVTCVEEFTVEQSTEDTPIADISEPSMT